MVEDGADGAVLSEHINTERAFQVAKEPLRGSRPSLRRRLFFRVGHKRVMSEATNNIAALLDRETSERSPLSAARTGS
jgi:hypothetical protein